MVIGTSSIRLLYPIAVGFVSVARDGIWARPGPATRVRRSPLPKSAKTHNRSEGVARRQRMYYHAVGYWPRELCDGGAPPFAQSQSSANCRSLCCEEPRNYEQCSCAFVCDGMGDAQSAGVGC